MIAVIVTAGLIVAAIAIDPQIDLIAARYAMLPADSALRPLVAVLREIFRFTPYAILLAGLIFIWRLATTGRISKTTSVRHALFLASTLALGPGLAVNAGLKSYSQRPRPFQTIEAGGTGANFRAFYQFDGPCERNCSFSSGEAASSFWTVAPALLAPPQFRVIATTAALCFGVLVSFLRMAIGAHFLSDVAFSAMLVLPLVLLLRRLIIRG